MTRGEPRPSAPAAHSVFWACLSLAVGLVVIKASYALDSDFWLWARPRDFVSWLYLTWAAAASQQDAVFALGSGLMAGLALCLTRTRPGVSRALATGYVAVGAVCIVYAIVGRQVFAYLGSQLTYQILSLGGETAQLRSSVAPYMSAPILGVAVAAPIIYLVAVRGSARQSAGWRRGMAQSVGAAAVVGAVGWLLLGFQLNRTEWFIVQDRYAVESPHWTLVESGLLNLFGVRSSLASVTFPAEYLQDFEPPKSPTAWNDSTAGGGDGGRPPSNVLVIVLESIGVDTLDHCCPK